MTLADPEGPNLDPAHYPGEDTSPTTKREIQGFFYYGWAAEVFVVCAMGSFVPMILEQLARGRGVLASDRLTPCDATVSSASTVFIESLTSSSPIVSLLSRRKEGEQCVCTVLGHEINTASFALYVFSASVLFQALVIVSISGAADHGKRRKSLLVITACIGSLATMLFMTATSNHLLFAASLAIIANTCFGASFVLLNSFLPLLVRNHPEVRELQLETQTDEPVADLLVTENETDSSEDRVADGSMDAESAPLLSSSGDSSATSASSALESDLVTRLTTQISATGIGIGYGAAIIVQTICITVVVLLRHKEPLWALRIALSIVGFWWFLFTIPAAARLKCRPGPPIKLPFEKSRFRRRTTRIGRLLHQLRILWAYVSVSWRSLLRTVGRARKLKDLLIFLLAWFFLSDGIATTSGTAILFAKTSLKMPSSSVAAVSVISTISGFMGAFGWRRIAAHFNWSPPQTMLVCNIIFAFIPIYGLLGYIPAIERLGFGGLQTPAEIYAFAVLYGFQLGGISSYCRAVYSQLIPPGSEAAFFALHAITDKGSSVIGPFAVGWITNKYGSIRPAFWFLAFLVIVPIQFLAMVDVERGGVRARELAADVVGDNVTKPTDNVNGPIEIVDNESASDDEGDPEEVNEQLGRGRRWLY